MQNEASSSGRQDEDREGGGIHVMSYKEAIELLRYPLELHAATLDTSRIALNRTFFCFLSCRLSNL